MSTINPSVSPPTIDFMKAKINTLRGTILEQIFEDRLLRDRFGSCPGSEGPRSDLTKHLINGHRLFEYGGELMEQVLHGAEPSGGQNTRFTPSRTSGLALVAEVPAKRAEVWEELIGKYLPPSNTAGQRYELEPSKPYDNPTTKARFHTIRRLRSIQSPREAACHKLMNRLRRNAGKYKRKLYSRPSVDSYELETAGTYLKEVEELVSQAMNMSLHANFVLDSSERPNKTTNQQLYPPKLDKAWNEWYRRAMTVQAKIMAATTATSRSDREKVVPAIDDMVEGGRETQTYGQGSSGDRVVKSNIDPGPSGYTSRLRQVRFDKPLGQSQDAQSSRR